MESLDSGSCRGGHAFERSSGHHGCRVIREDVHLSLLRHREKPILDSGRRDSPARSQFKEFDSLEGGVIDDAEDRLVSTSTLEYFQPFDNAWVRAAVFFRLRVE